MSAKLKRFSCTYQFNGRRICFTLEAEGFEDSSARLRAIGMTAVVKDEASAATKKRQHLPCAYQFNGQIVGFKLEDTSVGEAAERLRAIGRTAVVEGEQIVEGTLFQMPAKLLGRLGKAGAK
jgi:hypothetical protein